MAVYFYGCVTLDGYLADRNHGLSWLYETGSPEETGYDRFYSAMDVTLMGRRTFQALEEAGATASVYPTTKNYVFTHREFSHPGFTAVSGDAAEFVRACLKSSNEDGNEGKRENPSRNIKFAFTIFPKSAEFVEPAEKTLYHPAAWQNDKLV